MAAPVAWAVRSPMTAQPTLVGGRAQGVDRRTGHPNSLPGNPRKSTSNIRRIPLECQGPGPVRLMSSCAEQFRTTGHQRWLRLVSALDQAIETGDLEHA